MQEAITAERELTHSWYDRFNRGETLFRAAKTPVELPKADIDPASTSLDPKKIDEALGQKGEMSKGVYKVTIGRTTKMGDTEVGNTMGVNTWAAFGGSDDNAVVDGDFAVAESELQPVLKSLRSGGINVVAIHHHMSGESPRILFLHYWGRGKAIDLAGTIRKALDFTAWDGKTKSS